MVTNLLRGSSTLNPVFLMALQWAAELEASRLSDYALYQRYYDGAHNAPVPEKAKQTLEQYLQFRDNFCDVIVDALAERLTVTGFASEDQTLGSRAWEIWKVNQLDEGSATVHTQTAQSGDGFVIVDFDNETQNPRIRQQSPESIKVEYEDSSNTVISRAAKRWNYVDTSGPEPQVITRLTVYYPDRIEKYIAADDAQDAADYHKFQERLPTGEREPWPLPWVDSKGVPLGVPVFHFRNRANGDAYGRSEIDNVIPLQDALNKVLVDLLVVSDTQGFPQRWVSGAKEPAGGWTTGPGALWSFSNERAQAGQFDQADTSQLLATIDKLVNHIAARSRTPQHLFSTSGVYPSGEALKTAEAGLVSKCKNRATSYGNTWEAVIRFALRLDNAFRKGANWNLDTLLETQWADFETRNELLHTQAVMLKKPVIGTRQALREMGYSEQQVEQIIREVLAEAAAQTTLGDSLLNAFMQNQAPTDLNPAQVVGADQGTNGGPTDTTQPARFSGQT